MIEDNYEDIINLPHYEPKHHPRMSKYNRAAQFAPFAALTGYVEQVIETARLTDKKLEIDDGLKEILSNKLNYIQDNLNIKSEFNFIYFISDLRKSGGKYVKKKGIVKKIDIIEQYVQLIDKTKIPINDIISIEGELFNYLEID